MLLVMNGGNEGHIEWSSSSQLSSSLNAEQKNEIIIFKIRGTTGEIEDA